MGKRQKVERKRTYPDPGEALLLGPGVHHSGNVMLMGVEGRVQRLPQVLCAGVRPPVQAQVSISTKQERTVSKQQRIYQELFSAIIRGRKSRGTVPLGGQDGKKQGYRQIDDLASLEDQQ